MVAHQRLLELAQRGGQRRRQRGLGDLAGTVESAALGQPHLGALHLQLELAGRGDAEHAAAVLFFRCHPAGLLEAGQQRVHRAGAGGVGLHEQATDVLDQLVAVARLFADQRQHQQAQVAPAQHARLSVAAGDGGRIVFLARLGSRGPGHFDISVTSVQTIYR